MLSLLLLLLLSTAAATIDSEANSVVLEQGSGGHAACRYAGGNARIRLQSFLMDTGVILCLRVFKY